MMAWLHTMIHPFLLGLSIPFLSLLFYTKFLPGDQKNIITYQMTNNHLAAY